MICFIDIRDGIRSAFEISANSCYMVDMVENIHQNIEARNTKPNSGHERQKYELFREISLLTVI